MEKVQNQVLSAKIMEKMLLKFLAWFQAIQATSGRELLLRVNLEEWV
jgi:hypothetical protein